MKLRWRCVNGTDFVSNAIDMKEGGGSVCHVEFLLDEGHTFGAKANGGVKIRTLAESNIGVNVVKAFEAEVSQQQYSDVMDFLKKQDGKPYDFKADIGILVGSNWNDDSKWMCSELWTAAMEAGNIIRKIDAEVNHITPEEVLILSSAMFTRV